MTSTLRLIRILAMLAENPPPMIIISATDKPQEPV
jgi:hypothetical protein